MVPVHHGGGGWRDHGGRAVSSALQALLLPKESTTEPGGEARLLQEHTLLVATLLPLSCSVIILLFLCFCAMQCKFLEAAAPAMEDQLVVTVGECVPLYRGVTESHVWLPCIMIRDCLLPSRVLRYQETVMQENLCNSLKTNT